MAMADIDYEPFNPFNVGPPNSGKRMEFQIPTSPTYPPPVFATVPQDKQGYIRRSVSQESAPAVQKTDTASRLKVGQSQIGEVAVSKAINEEMATAKQQAAALDDEGRFDAGGISKMRLPSSKSSIDSKAKVQSKVSVRTLLPVKSRRQASVDGQARKRSTSEFSVSTKASKVSRGSIRTRASTSSSARSKSRSSSVSKRSKKSQSSIVSKRSQSSTRSRSSAATSKASLGKSLGRAANKLNTQSTTESSITLTSEVLKQHSKIESVKATSSKMKSKSKVSLKSKTARKSSDALSVRSRSSKTIEKQTQRYSNKPKRTSETLSQDSVQSKTKYTTPSTFFKAKKEESTVALKSKRASSKASLKGKNRPTNKLKTVKALAEGTSLIHQAAEITERLKAGNEDNYRRYSSVIHNHSRTVPEKQFREDRMSFWFQDAVLS